MRRCSKLVPETRLDPGLALADLGWSRSSAAVPRGTVEEPSRCIAASLALRPLRSDFTFFSICSRSCSARAFT